MLEFLHYAQFPFTLFCLFAIQVLGLQIILGGTGLFSLGQASFYTIGGYVSAIFTVFIAPKIGLSHSPHLLLFLACLVGIVASVLAAFLIALPCLKLREDYLAMATLGFGEIVVTIFKNIEAVGGTRGFNNIPKLSSPLLAFIVLGCVVVFVHRLYKTNLGYSFKATRDDEISARSFGINIYRTKMVSFLIGAALSSLAGVLYVHTVQFISPDEAGFYNSVVLILALVVGGMYSVWGSLLGAAIIFALPEIFSFLPRLTDPYIAILADKKIISPSTVTVFNNIVLNRTLIFSVFVIFIMLLNPKGIVSLFHLRKRHQKNIVKEERR